MVEVIFEYKDRQSKGECRTQKCTCKSVQECIDWYGLEEPDVEYKIISVKEIQ